MTRMNADSFVVCEYFEALLLLSATIRVIRGQNFLKEKEYGNTA